MPRKPATQKSLEALARRILALETRSDARRTAAAGRAILDEVYDGDIGAFQSKDNTKGRSLAALGRLLGRSPGRVWGMVATAIVYEELPKDLRDQLTPTHLETLYHADEIERERLARESVAAGHTVEELRARVGGKILPDPDDQPPPDRSPLGRAERSAAALARAAEAAKPEEKPEMARRLDAVIARLVEVRSRLA